MREKFDRLIQEITQNQSADDILTARQNYQKRAGEIYEDDKSYEARMGLFLEWYIFDRQVPGMDKTPLELLSDQNGRGGVSKELKNGDEFFDHVNGLFIIKKISASEVTALNLVDNKKYSVKEDEGKILFNKNDLFEGRIVLMDGNYFFTPNFCFHPKEAEKFIKAEVKKIITAREVFLKELKHFNSQLKDLNSRLDKNAREIVKINGKVEKTNSTDKIHSLNEKLDALKRVRAELTQQISLKKAEISNLETIKIKNEIGVSVSHLIQKLGYMNLKWERSRQIDLHDIYRN